MQFAWGLARTTTDLWRLGVEQRGLQVAVGWMSACLLDVGLSFRKQGSHVGGHLTQVMGQNGGYNIHPFMKDGASKR